MRVMVVGIGHVGRALLRAWSRARPGLRLVAALDSRGRFERAEGLDPADVVARKLRGEYDAPLDGTAAERIHAVHPDVLVELTPTDVATGEPAVPAILAALRLGAHVVTSAKSHQRSRADLERVALAARESGAIFLDHAAHLAGIPVTEMMAGVGMEVVRLEGVLNGTTNFILKRLEEGKSFEEALEEAIKRGFAEKEWRYDVQGTDVGIKLVGLARRLMGRTLDLSEIERAGIAPGKLGIEGIDGQHVRDLLANGRRVKLFGEVEADGNGVRARVGPRVFPVDDPFARIDGFKNAIAIHGIMNGTRMDLFLSGPGAGADETASRVLGNLNYLFDLVKGRAAR
jgi:homoserine dehydrogenase